MKYLIYLIGIILILGLNVGLFNSLQISGQIPNLLLLLVVYFAADKKDFDFFFVAFISGLLLDFYSTGFFGAYTAGFLILALVLHLLVNQFLVLELNWKTLSLFIAGSLVLLDVCLWAFGAVVYKLNITSDYLNFKVFVDAFLPALLYDLLFLYPMYLLYSSLRRGVDNFTTRRRGLVR